MHSKLARVQLDQLEDSAFTLISKADARRKKYADGFIFWMDNNDEVAAISTGNYVDLKSGRSSVFTGKITNADDNFDPEGKDPYYMAHGGKYTNDKGEEVKYEFDTKRIVSLDRETTLNLQRDPYIEYCYFLPFSITNEKKSNREPYSKGPSNEDIRRDNRERYETVKVSRRKTKSKDCLLKYDSKFKSIVVKPLRDQLKEFFKGIDQSTKGGISPYGGNIQTKLPHSINRMEEFFKRYYHLINALDRDYFYDRTIAADLYEKDVQEQKSKMDEFLDNFNN